MELKPTETHTVTTPDGVELLLTRVRGGKKGPVMLVHGAGVWSGMFALPTIEENFVQYLAKREYDVWLLDWRASIRLPLRQFTLDDAAEHDFPAAIAKIREVTKAATVQAVTHCAGSIAFFMSLAAGYLEDVRCVTASQVALHYDAPPVTDWKSALRVPGMIDAVGIDYLSATEAPEHPIFQALLTKAVDVAHHECDSSVCHRITFLYGHLYRHEKLDKETHARLDEQFGKCAVLPFRHLAQLVRQGYASKFDYGEEGNLQRYASEKPPTYLKPEHLRIPITFVSGEKNACFLPQSTLATFDWLRDAHGDALYKRRVVPGYGHIDGFMGSRASREVYPHFIEQLEACP